MTRTELIDHILEAKLKKHLTWEMLAKAAGRSEIWTTAALLGQMSMDKKEAEAIVKKLGLDKEAALLLQQCPSKGSLGTTVPTDPLLYRFYEIIQVYGTTLKTVIHEKFGDGIMSAIDFEMHLDKIPDPKGDRVKITLNGKFLPYKKW